ncbi:MAG: class I SAM-dependent methyltransferase [Gammaproteobacteria bacterium]|nr:class I SAM-dependent methyltransferase [Gammaproteobacteria bacterium]MBT4493996.1 class I SAM-dependent methyltransferase [Gammaproteobacteria bacterium]MBT7371813.1 class I SAM-dependent methyltransferase [Gammaproteobacteria bacterium]
MTRFKVCQTECGLGLEDRFSAQRPLAIDFENQDFLRRLTQAGRKGELVAKAVKPGAGVKLMDCTAGLGADAFILAHLGCDVTLVERSNVVHALLEDAVSRAARNPKLSVTASRINLIHGDAIELLAVGSVSPDVIYLDPMFPEKAGSALVSGEMQILQRFLGPDHDVFALLDAALESEARKIVLKRPPRSDWHPPRAPDHVITGRNSRFEVWAQRA